MPKKIRLYGRAGEMMKCRHCDKKFIGNNRMVILQIRLHLKSTHNIKEDRDYKNTMKMNELKKNKIN